MNDKQQLAAIGEQLTAMGERMGVQVQPMCMAKRIEELCGDVQRIEFFARESFPGWSCWGNQAPGEPANDNAELLALAAGGWA